MKVKIKRETVSAYKYVVQLPVKNLFCIDFDKTILIHYKGNIKY